MARPYKIREEQNKKEFPAEKADVKKPALTTLGRTLIPAWLIAMMKGDCDVDNSVSVRDSKRGSFDATVRPITNIPRM